MKSESIFHQAKYRLLSLMKRVNDLQTKTTPCTYDQIITLDQEFRACQFLRLFLATSAKKPVEV